MNKSTRKTGHYERFGDKDFFIPDPLPPHDPILELDSEAVTLYGQAMFHVAQVNEIQNSVPDARRFLKAYTIKEAVISSNIEGINTTLLDVFTQPLLDSKPSKETQLVMNYPIALYEAIDMIKKDLPISSRVILKAHEILMQVSDSGDKSDPGNYRKQAVSVGNLIPPPWRQIPDLMSGLFDYINTDESLPPLIKAGLAHVQFETIHPFLDGNGRIGRLLIVLMLIESGLLSEPIIYPSYYFKRNRNEYYRSLDRVRTHGDFEGWIKFYLAAIQDSSVDAYKRAQEIGALWRELSDVLKNKFTKTTLSSRREALSVLFTNPVINVNELKTKLDITYNTANKIITEFVDLGIVHEGEQKRGQLFTFDRYLDILQRE